MRYCFAALLALLLSLPLPVSAHSPDITLVVGFVAGGTSSAAARALLEPLARASGRRVMVENKPGAGGLIAAQFVANHAPESGLLLFMSASSSLRVPTDLGLVPVALVARYDFVLVGKLDLTLDAYLQRARRDRRLQSVGTPGAGSTSHLSLAQVFRERGVPMLHVPYQGAAPAINAVLGEHIALAGVPYPDFLPFKDTLHVIARTGSGFSVGGWMGVYAPPGTTPAQAARMASWFKAAAEESKDLLSRIGFIAQFAPGEDLARQHEADRAAFLPELELQGVRF